LIGGMVRGPILAALGAALLLAACATTPAPPPPAPPPPPVAQGPVSPVPPPAPADRTVRFADLPGWAQEDHVAALTAFQAGCVASREASLRALCDQARILPALDEHGARDFLETHFRAERVGELGLLTAYFAPQYQARERRGGAYTAPVRAKPAELVMLDLGLFDASLAGKKVSGHVVGGKFTPYYDRAQIEAMPAEHALAWMKPEDLFVMQIQGSGVLAFPDGHKLKALFNGSNGKPFVGIAQVMRDKGLLADNDTSGEAIRAWLADHRGPEADAIMRQNPRYVFFKLAPDDGRDPVGAAGTPLLPGRALAVDPSKHALGRVYWIDASAPALAGAFPTYRRMAIALDTGGAIKGLVRADLYTGVGPGAGVEAGRVRHVLKLYELQPVETATP
jgi:membrane-bound lytic murein transglycosylase A